MANVMNYNTGLWVVDSVGTRDGVGSSVVEAVVLIPSAVDDTVTFQDDGESEDAIFLQAGPSDTSPVVVYFNRPRPINNIKCSQISDGAKAYVYLRN
jgi:hypothetical protein